MVQKMDMLRHWPVLCSKERTLVSLLTPRIQHTDWPASYLGHIWRIVPLTNFFHWVWWKWHWKVFLRRLVQLHWSSNHRYYSYSYMELIGALLQGTGHYCLASLLIGCRRRVSVAACPFAAPWIAKAARYPIRARLFPLSRDYSTRQKKRWFRFRSFHPIVPLYMYHPLSLSQTLQKWTHISVEGGF